MPYRVFAIYLKLKKGLFMKKVKLTRIIAVAICAAISVLGCVFLKPQTDINQAAADTVAETEFSLSDVSFYFETDEIVPKLRLKLFIPQTKINQMTETRVVSGEQIYPYSLHVLVDKDTSKIHDSDLKSSFVYTTIIYQSPDSDEFKKSEISEFVKENDLYLKTLNAGNGTFYSDMVKTTPELYTYINIDFDLPLPYDYEHTIYVCMSETQSYVFLNPGSASKENVGPLFVGGAKNVYKANITGMAKAEILANGSKYNSAQLDELKKIADGVVSDTSKQKSESTSSLDLLRKMIIGIGGVAVLGLLFVGCLSLGAKQKTSVNVSVGERNITGGKVRQRKK